MVRLCSPGCAASWQWRSWQPNELQGSTVPAATTRAGSCPLRRSQLGTCRRPNEDMRCEIAVRAEAVAAAVVLRLLPSLLVGFGPRVCCLSVSSWGNAALGCLSLLPYPWSYVQLITALETSKPRGPAEGKGGKPRQQMEGRPHVVAWSVASAVCRTAQGMGHRASAAQLCIAKHSTAQHSKMQQRTTKRGPQVGCSYHVILVLLKVLPKALQKNVLWCNGADAGRAAA